MAKAILKEHHFKTRDQLFDSLSEDLLARLGQGLETRKSASLVLSGGNTPVPLYARMAQAELPWDHVSITLADERWVDPQHESSNELLLRRNLLKGAAAAAKLVSLKSEHTTPEEGQSTIEQRLHAIHRPFDIVLLGMGNDGHTASLFPDGDNLTKALQPQENQLCISMRAPGATQARITLTLPALLQCQYLVILCTGQDKHDTFARALAGDSVEAMPIRALLQTKRQLAFYWAP